MRTRPAKRDVPVLAVASAVMPTASRSRRVAAPPEPVPTVWPELAPEPQRPGAVSARGARRYRVNQAPTLSVLGGDRRLMTLASLLLMRPVNLAELTLQSGMDAPECERGLARLMALGLLVVSDPEAADVRPGAARRRSVPEPPPADADGSVLARWKDLLGLRGRQ